MVNEHEFAKATLLITGGTGSFGNAVLQRFLRSDITRIRIFSRDEKTLIRHGGKVLVVRRDIKPSLLDQYCNTCVFSLEKVGYKVRRRVRKEVTHEGINICLGDRERKPPYDGAD